MVAPQTRQRVRYTLVRYRRPLAAGCAAASVLLTIAALRPAPASSDQPTDPMSTASEGPSGWSSQLTSGTVASPVRLADADTAGLLAPGMVVDVLAADGKGRATLVADSVEVLQVPAVDQSALASTGFGGALVVLAVSSDEATELAASGAVGPLSVVLVG